MYTADSVVVSVILLGGGGGPVMIIIITTLFECDCNDYYEHNNSSVGKTKKLYNWH